MFNHNEAVRPNSPKQRRAVRPKSRVARYERESLHSSLSDEQPVERIPIVKRDYQQFPKMFEARWQLTESIIPCIP